jgi:hypothetical protein
MISSGVKSDHPWRCSPVAEEKVPGLRHPLCRDRLLVSKRIVCWPSASLRYLAVSWSAVPRNCCVVFARKLCHHR